MALISNDEFRAWVGHANLPDAVVGVVVAEAEASLLADLGLTDTSEIEANTQALAVATGEELRRAQRFLARKNSPEGIAGGGEYGIAVPIRDPDSQVSIWRLMELLDIGIPVA